jgi:hypothetical protein
LCPLATEWNRITGFAPNTASAKASRSGLRRRTVHAMTASVARLAAIASERKTTMIDGIVVAARATPDETSSHSGPYTAGVSAHFGPT